MAIVEEGEDIIKEDHDIIEEATGLTGRIEGSLVVHDEAVLGQEHQNVDQYLNVPGVDLDNLIDLPLLGHVAHHLPAPHLATADLQ